ncbi:MOSC domain-containing protein [Pseudosporangium ferrugineum]|uniref:MOSC domain-containing protein YiiM n=1 Tax=Pseudosporangium ferrugineum TaxID=439699 RepID=A0A2T0RMP2_9ACTN|nr:MOSC domain-containing protein [Pseudosporangium ferrugineum]PRY22428.1 MOSC domain-containing protein YiiM [Pseudosporangium ferrugineum]
MSRVLQVNLAVPERSDAKNVGITGINKQPVSHAVAVRAPGPKGLPSDRASGLAGDQIFDTAHHGGDDQAVYAYAREDYDWWEKELGRELPGGLFGENLTTADLDVSGAELGETWRIGDTLVLQTTFGRIPCATFQWKMGEPRWVKRFAAESRPGAYLRVVTPGEVRAGDEVTVVDRPGHGVTIADSFRAWMHDPALLASYLELGGVPDGLKADIRRKLRLA